MSRQRIQPITEMEKYRKRAGFELTAFEKHSGVSRKSIWRLERGEIISTVLAAKYLRGLGIDMNRPETFPERLKIVDYGSNVQVQLTPQ